MIVGEYFPPFFLCLLALVGGLVDNRCRAVGLDTGGWHWHVAMHHSTVAVDQCSQKRGTFTQALQYLDAIFTAPL